MEENKRKELHKKILLNLFITLCGILVLIFLGPRLLRFFMPMLVAWIIAMIANPMVMFLEKRIKIMRKHGSVIVIVLVLLLVGGICTLAVIGTINQISSLIQDLPDLYQSISENLQESLGKLHETFSFIPKNLQDIINKRDDKVNEIILSFINSLQTSPVAAVGSFASSLIDVFVLAILTLMLSYFFIVEREQIKTAFSKYMPAPVKNLWKMALDTCLTAIGGYFKACFKIMLVIYVVLLIVFLALGVDYAALIALITAVLDFLPFLGTGIILGPWAVYCAITGEYVTVIVLGITYVISLMIHRLLEPKLVGDSVGMSPFATLVSMFIGYRLIGMLGLIIGIPVGMVVVALWEQRVFESQIRGIKILAKDISEYRKY